ncbi:MAG: tetratricopeptide repeat protein [Rubrivivax sp.]|nr:tetratricopeptide repeat protein [Rubrivivax sp.]
MTPTRSPRAAGRTLWPSAVVLLGLSMAPGPGWAQPTPPAATAVAEVRALLARGDASAALPLAERLSKASPDDAQLAFLHAVVLMDLRRDGDAMLGFVRLNELYPELPEPLNNIGLLHARAGRLDAARQALESALRNAPEHRAARLNLGEVYLMLAVQAWEQVAAAAPLAALQLQRLQAARSLLPAVNR